MSSAEILVASPAPVFAALGDPTRLSLLMRLSDGERRSIAALSADTALTRQAVTKHLQVLEKAGLVGMSRVGRESRYAYRPEPLAEARAYLDTVSAQWEGALGRLKSLVEG
jgi:DNA-binding transcriptional ArsR family regulator